MNHDNHWPTVGELVNANWCGRREEASRHDQYLESCVSEWKDQIRIRLIEIVKHKSAVQEITNAAPRCWGLDIARLAMPIVVAFLKVQFPDAAIYFGESEEVYVIVDWTFAPLDAAAKAALDFNATV